MPNSYRITRNTEASLIEYITAQLIVAGWNNFRTVKSFSEVYEGALPCICINSPERPINRRELGTDTTTKEINIEIRIFAENDGQRLDVADWMVEKLLSGCPYNVYTINNGTIQSRVLSGRIHVIRISENRKELTNTTNLEKEDRYRHLITLNCRIALI